MGLRPKQFVLFLIAFFAVFSISGCATIIEATWKTVPETSMQYERAWNIVVNTISNHFEIETIDAQSGYLRTQWKITDTDIFGVPIQRARATVRVEERSPFKVKVKVEKQEPSGFIAAAGWYDKGNHEKLEAEILSELAGRLR